MKYFVVEPFTLETPQGRVTLPTGKILELSQDQAERLIGKVEIVTPLSQDVIEREYHSTLTRFWSPEAERLSDGELEKLLARLDELFRELTRQGRRLSILTPEGRAYLKEV